MTATIIKFPWKNFPVTVPLDHGGARVIKLGRKPAATPEALAWRLAKRRQLRRLKKLPKVIHLAQVIEIPRS